MDFFKTPTFYKSRVEKYHLYKNAGGFSSFWSCRFSPNGFKCQQTSCENESWIYSFSYCHCLNSIHDAFSSIVLLEFESWIYLIGITLLNPWLVYLPLKLWSNILKIFMVSAIFAGISWFLCPFYIFIIHIFTYGIYFNFIRVLSILHDDNLLAQPRTILY